MKDERRNVFVLPDMTSSQLGRVQSLHVSSSLAVAKIGFLGWKAQADTEFICPVQKVRC